MERGSECDFLLHEATQALETILCVGSGPASGFPGHLSGLARVVPITWKRDITWKRPLTHVSGQEGRQVRVLPFV